MLVEKPTSSSEEVEFGNEPDSKRNPFLKLLIIVGVLALLGFGGVFGYKYFTKQKQEKPVVKKNHSRLYCSSSAENHSDRAECNRHSATLFDSAS